MTDVSALRMKLALLEGSHQLSDPDRQALLAAAITALNTRLSKEGTLDGTSSSGSNSVDPPASTKAAPTQDGTGGRTRSLSSAPAEESSPTDQTEPTDVEIRENLRAEEAKADLEQFLSLTNGAIPQWSALATLAYSLGTQALGGLIGSPEWDAFVQTNFNADGSLIGAADEMDFSAFATVPTQGLAREDVSRRLEQVGVSAMVLDDNLSQLSDRRLSAQTLTFDNALFAEIYSENEHLDAHRNLVVLPLEIGSTTEIGLMSVSRTAKGLEFFLKGVSSNSGIVAQATETISAYVGAGATAVFELGAFPVTVIVAFGVLHGWAWKKAYDLSMHGPNITIGRSRPSTGDIAAGLNSRLSSGTSTDGLAPSVGLTPTEEQTAMRLQAELQILLNSDGEPDPQAALKLIDDSYAAGIMPRAVIEAALGGLPENQRLLLSNTAVANTGGAQNYWTYLQGHTSAIFSLATEIFYNADIDRLGAFEGLIHSAPIAYADPHTTPEQQEAINVATALEGVDEKTQAGVFGSWASAHDPNGPNYMDRADALLFDTLRVMASGATVFSPTILPLTPDQSPGVSTWAQTDPHGFNAMLLRSAQPGSTGELAALMLNSLGPDQALGHLYRINDGAVSLGTFASQLQDPTHALNKIFSKLDADLQSDVLSAIDTLAFVSLESAQQQAQYIIDLVPVDVDVNSGEYRIFVRDAADLLSALPLDQQGAVWAELLAAEVDSDRAADLLPVGTSAAILEKLAQQDDIEPLDLYLTAAEAVAANHPDASPMLINILLAAGVPPEDVGKVIAHMARIAYEKAMGSDPYGVEFDSNFVTAPLDLDSETILATDDAAVSAAGQLVASILSTLPPDAPQTEIVMALFAELAVVFGGSSGGGGGGGASVAGGGAGTSTAGGTGVGDDDEVSTAASTPIAVAQVGGNTDLPDEVLAMVLALIDPVDAADFLLGPGLRDRAPLILRYMDDLSRETIEIAMAAPVQAGAMMRDAFIHDPAPAVGIFAAIATHPARAAPILGEMGILADGRAPELLADFSITYPQLAGAVLVQMEITSPGIAGRILAAVAATDIPRARAILSAVAEADIAQAGAILSAVALTDAALAGRLLGAIAIYNPERAEYILSQIAITNAARVAAILATIEPRARAAMILAGIAETDLVLARAIFAPLETLAAGAIMDELDDDVAATFLSPPLPTARAVEVVAVMGSALAGAALMDLLAWASEAARAIFGALLPGTRTDIWNTLSAADRDLLAP